MPYRIEIAPAAERQIHKLEATVRRRIIETEATPFTMQVLESLKTAHAVTPALWPFEVANALVDAERRGRINPAQQGGVSGAASAPVADHHRAPAGPELIADDGQALFFPV